MKAFRNVSEATVRRIDRVMLGMAGSDTLEELEEGFLGEAGKLLPADCLCWNRWAPDWSRMITCRSDDQHDAWLETNQEVFDTHVGYHPVIVAHPLSVTAQQVMRMSDHQRVSEFRCKNPLYREVYRHLGFVYQICYTAASLRDHKLILTWTREAVDFSDAEMQVFQLMGLRLGAVSRRIDERQRLDRAWHELCGFVDKRLAVGTVRSLRPGEIDLLTEFMKGQTAESIARGQGIRRDSVDKRLGAIRERLGLENHRQLLSALAEFKRARGRPR